MSDDPNSLPDVSQLSDSEAGELKSLRAEMSDTTGRNYTGHWSDHYWASETKQARARELMAREGSEARDAPTPPGASSQAPSAGSVVPAAGGRAPVANVSELASIANTLDLSADAVEAGYDVALDIEGAFGSAAADINAAIGGLSDGLRGAMVAELSNVYVPRLGEADRADLDKFAGTPHGKICAARWGADTARRLAIALYRNSRLEDSLDDASFRSWQDFFRNRLSASERAAILDRMTT